MRSTLEKHSGNSVCRVNLYRQCLYRIICLVLCVCGDGGCSWGRASRTGRGADYVSRSDYRSCDTADSPEAAQFFMSIGCRTSLQS